VGALAASASARPLVNADFEAGLAGWSSGGASVSAVGFELSRDSILAGAQAPFDGDWDPQQGALFASLWSTDSAGTDSSFLEQTFAGLTGEVINFMVAYDFGDFAASGADGAYVTIFDGLTTTTLAEFNTAGSGFLGDDENIDWTPVMYVLPGSAVYTLRFEIFDASGDFESLLMVDAKGGVIPLPSAAGLGLAGLGLVGSRRRRG
jgi:hypothetical protein